MRMLSEAQDENPPPRTLTDLVKHIENTLGWLPAEGEPAWKSRGAEVSKLKRVIAKDPQLYTMENLLLAVDYLYRHRKSIQSPVYVAYTVERALKERPRAEPGRPLQQRLDAALAAVRGLEEGAERQRWERRFAVAQGKQLEVALSEWEQAHG